MRKNSLMIFVFLLMIAVMVGCNHTGIEDEGNDIVEPVAIEDVTFQLTDELKDYMDSQEIEGLALVTTLCRS